MVEFVNVSAWVKHQHNQNDKLVGKIMFHTDSALSLKSPVKTGQFKANWQLGIDSYPTGYTLGKTDSAPLGTIGKTVLEHAAMMPQVNVAGRVYYLVNNLPYAWALERGRSAQTGNHRAGIVGLTILEIDGIAQRAMAEIK